MILGARGALAPLCGRDSKVVSKKTISARNPPPLFETFFEFFGTFRRFIFYRFFGCSQIPNFRHFGAKRVPKSTFLGSLFGAIPRLVAKVRMKLPCRRQHRCRGFREPKKRQISPLFPGGVRGSSGPPFSHAFYDFGCPPGSKKEPILELAGVFLLSEILLLFEVFGCRGRRQGFAPGIPNIC